jgi:hypothetical protein
MSRAWQLQDIDRDEAQEVREYLEKLRKLGALIAPTLSAAARRIHMSRSGLSRAMSGDRPGSWERTQDALHALASEDGVLRELGIDNAELHRLRKAAKRAKDRASAPSEPTGPCDPCPFADKRVVAPLPVPTPRGDRQLRFQVPPPAHALAARVTELAKAGNQTGLLSSIREGAEGLTPQDNAAVVAVLSNRGVLFPAQHYVRSYGRDQPSSATMRFARDLIDVYKLPGMAVLALTSALPAGTRLS